ncbi:hypothetical protein [Neobacillus dielmonensis]|uniref:hypothetical protein n=1 Tax=Neobacillus dielmonensis TaxID=1347369 RepID=UPI0005A90982|nr:hypothetical protein [Neobacillus dielmonensis]
MNVSVDVHFVSNGIRILRSGSFPLRGKSKETVALSFWKRIQNEMPFGSELEKIIVNGEVIPLDSKLKGD